MFWKYWKENNPAIKSHRIQGALDQGTENQVNSWGKGANGRDTGFYLSSIPAQNINYLAAFWHSTSELLYSTQIRYFSKRWFLKKTC